MNAKFFNWVKAKPLKQVVHHFFYSRGDSEIIKVRNRVIISSFCFFLLPREMYFIIIFSISLQFLLIYFSGRSKNFFMSYFFFLQKLFRKKKYMRPISKIFVKLITTICKNKIWLANGEKSHGSAFNIVIPIRTITFFL